MRNILVILLLILPLLSFAQPIIPTTGYTLGFMTNQTAASARTYLGISGSGGSGTSVSNVFATLAFTGNTNVVVPGTWVEFNGTNQFFTNAYKLSLTTNAFFDITTANLVFGQQFSIWVNQTSTNSFTVNWNTNKFYFASGFLPTQSTASNSWDLYSCAVMPSGTNVLVVQTPNAQP